MIQLSILCSCWPTILAPVLSSLLVSTSWVTSCLIEGGREFRARWSASWLVVRFWSYRLRTLSMRSSHLIMAWTAFCSSAALCREAVHLISPRANVPGGRPIGVALPDRAMRVSVEEVEGTWETSSLSLSMGTKLPLPWLDCDIFYLDEVSDSYLPI